ncbi:endo-1,3(4)-beta-glucanase [Ceratobasidium sp. AG-Ba]|nr:endo-1,3(4)-beta-glucanase [Ceratobasidium sp. AG-Ba]
MGGGWFVTERTGKSFSIWFWGRNDEGVPPAVELGLPVICTKDFGEPIAYWEASDTCDFSKMFGPHNIIINLTLCGDWAGQNSVFQKAGCPGTCVDYVNNNPATFKDAYWEINSLKVYSKLY